MDETSLLSTKVQVVEDVQRSVPQAVFAPTAKQADVQAMTSAAPTGGAISRILKEYRYYIVLPWLTIPELLLLTLRLDATHSFLQQIPISGNLC